MKKYTEEQIVKVLTDIVDIEEAMVGDIPIDLQVDKDHPFIKDIINKLRAL